jgi:hypothetical protein
VQGEGFTWSVGSSAAPACWADAGGVRFLSACCRIRVAGLLLLMYARSTSFLPPSLQPTELAPDGKPVFKGPPVAMAVHQSCEFTAIR